MPDKTKPRPRGNLSFELRLLAPVSFSQQDRKFFRTIFGASNVRQITSEIKEAIELSNSRLANCMREKLPANQRAWLLRALRPARELLELLDPHDVGEALHLLVDSAVIQKDKARTAAAWKYVDTDKESAQSALEQALRVWVSESERRLATLSRQAADSAGGARMRNARKVREQLKTQLSDIYDSAANSKSNAERERFLAFFDQFAKRPISAEAISKVIDLL